MTRPSNLKAVGQPVIGTRSPSRPEKTRFTSEDHAIAGLRQRLAPTVSRKDRDALTSDVRNACSGSVAWRSLVPVRGREWSPATGPWVAVVAARGRDSPVVAGPRRR